MSKHAEAGAELHRAFKNLELALQADGFELDEIGLAMIGYATGLLSREYGDFLTLRGLDEARRAMLDRQQETMQ